MPVPEDIRKVSRPKNTIVFAYGKNKDLYGVKSRTGCIRKDGRNVPVDGPVIGHIVNGTFMPLDDTPKIKHSDADYLRWADAVLCDSLSKDILEDLREVYHGSDAVRTYVIAMLRAIEPDIRDCELGTEYEETFLSLMYPNVPLSKNSVGDHLRDLGRTCSRMTKFMQIRAERVCADHIVAIDSTLKSDESYVNTFSDASYKTRHTGRRGISIVYAFDVNTGEPVCSKAYPGNVVDVSLLEDFIRTQKVYRGMIVVDKGFSYGAAKDAFSKNPDLHFLIPLKRDAKVIAEYRMYDYNASVPGRSGLACRKEKMNDGKILYSFRDAGRASQEESDWIGRHSEYDPAELAGLRKEFGSIVFISDADMDCGVAYAAYEERWKIEKMFWIYKDILGFDQTRVHSDTAVMGTEFVNFLSVLMEYRMRRAFSKVRELDGVPHRIVLRKLRRATKIRNSDGKWELRKISEKDVNVLIELGLIPMPETVKKKRGRPKKVVPG